MGFSRMGGNKGHVLAVARCACIPQLHCKAILHSFDFDDADTARGRPSVRQQISLWVEPCVTHHPQSGGNFPLAGPARRSGGAGRPAA